MIRLFEYSNKNELSTKADHLKMMVNGWLNYYKWAIDASHGFMKLRRPGGKSMIKVDKSTSYIIQKIYRDFLARVPRFLIHKEVKELGFPQSGNGTIFRILINPLYAGLVRVCAHGKFLGKIVKGLHEPIVSESQYWSIQEMLGLLLFEVYSDNVIDIKT